MKKFSCGDVVPGCTASFEGTNDDEILQKVAKHANDDHGLKEVSEDLVKQVRAKIHDAP